MIYQLVVILKGVNEVALMALIGQGALFILAGARRKENFAYTLLQTVTSPITKATRFITPRFIVDQHIGLVALFILLILEVLLIILKIRLYLAAIAG